MLVEQAIFTSASTDRADGYQVVAHSPGVSEGDLAALATWCPTHDSLLGADEHALSHNFHPLPSGAWCISRSTPSDGEYSGRGRAVYTQCLVVPRSVLERFGNNPFAVLRAASASGRLEALTEIPPELPAFELPGRSPSIDRAVFAQLAVEPGATTFAKFVDAALNSTTLAVTGSSDVERVFAGLFSCLPLACRLEFTFATGLKSSPRRPLRIYAAAENRRGRQQGVDVFDFGSSTKNAPAELEGWAALVATAITCGNPALLPVDHPPGDSRVTAAGLAQLGNHLHDQLQLDFVELSARSMPAPPAAEADHQRADAPHARFASQSEPPAATACKQRPSRSPALCPQSPEVLELLEHLDDLVFSAIDGQSMALEKLEVIWPLVLEELGPQMVEESREQYLRYAMEIWSDCLEQEGPNPAKAVTALDVLCVLINE